jgi:hypothetical protein
VRFYPGGRRNTEAENKAEAWKVIKEFSQEFGTNWPVAAAKIVDEKEALDSSSKFPG